ncbi:Pre-mRNA-splicing factor [Nymphaea thermarum]|nr:Pre-mRNA-splicing factor [Nymphaea thermarum]
MGAGGAEETVAGGGQEGEGQKEQQRDKLLYPDDKDLLYEEEIQRNPFTLKLWWRYLIAHAESPFRRRSVIYERALRALPGSYKLWHAYLLERLKQVKHLPVTHPRYESLNNTFERALVTMHKMPVIWIMYLTSLTQQQYVTRTRHAFDRALRSLPVTQHDRIWDKYLTFVGQKGVPIETSLRVYRRYLKFDPTHIEDFIDFLLRSGLWQEAAERLAGVLNDESFRSIQGKTRHQLWLELCDLLTKHACEVSGLKVDAIIRGGIRQFTDEVGRLWTSLADYYIRRGMYEKARDIYEEGMRTVITVRDFGMIFDSYTQYEESMLAAKMETLDIEEEGGEQFGGENGAGEKVDGENGGAGGDTTDLRGFWLADENDIDLRLARLEHLMDRRPEIVSSVLLRQNPHNVHEWHKRVKLFKNNPERQIMTFTEAVKTVDPMKAVGKPHTLWVAFAKLYENHKDLANARVVFERAVQVNYKALDDLASVWCEWAEMELRHKNFKGALGLLRRATAEPSVEVKRRVAADGNEPVQIRLHRSLKLWTFYLDIEESLGNLDSTREVYERILDLRIATPQIIINYAFLLEENKYFEDAFKVYERGVKIFKYPHVKDIWVTYLSKFVKRYGKSKLERARELFEQAVRKAPAEDVKPLYLQYAKLEEDFGLAKSAMKVYDQATKAVPDHEKMKMYEIYIARAAEIFGVPKTRQIYEQAIESGLPDKDVKTMSMKYADLEKSLGEIDRARGIYNFAAQFADPRSDTDFWSTWHEFEVQHGNEDTFREMLRVKRTVSASFSQRHNILPEYLMQQEQKQIAEEAADKHDQMAALERQLASPAVEAVPKDGMRALGFVSGGVEGQVGTGGGGNMIANPEDIELEEDGEDDFDERVEVAQKDVPVAVFGDLAKKVEADKSQSNASEDVKVARPLGALERLKKRQKT